jgi:hypothetical protein
MGRILTAAGARAVEALLLTSVDEDQALLTRDPSLLGEPLRIVVPSRTLQEHVAARICAHRGGAAGIVVQTHFQLARELWERNPKRSSTTHDSLFSLLVRREADSHPILGEMLRGLVQGTRAVVSSVDDLLHAECSLELSDALFDSLEEMKGTDSFRRARAILELTLGTSARFREIGLLTRDDLITQVASILREDAGSFARGILIHGFADATGVVTDFLEALLRHPNALTLLDRPRDPARADRPDLGIEFSRPFGLRLGESAKLPEAEADPPQVSAFCAPGARAEAREVARRLRALLGGENPPVPESVAIVARSLDRHFLDLTESLDEYGVPWRAPQATGSVDPARRRLMSLVELLRRGVSLPVDRWLELNEHKEDAWRFRLAAATLGLGRLGQLAALSDEEIASHAPRLELPIRHGFELRRDEEGNESGAFPRESLSELGLRTLRNGARDLTRHLLARPKQQGLPQHAASLRSFVRETLGWTLESESADALERLETLLRGFDTPLTISHQEFLDLLEDELENVQGSKDAGNRGGVQILDVTKARGFTFAHLYLVGLNRAAFPASVREDALLPDRVRVKLRGVLPDLKSKRERGREERFLFAQLFSSAPSVTLSWWTTDDDGRPTPPSPFVQRLRLEEREDAFSSPSLFELETTAFRPRPLQEHLLEAALRDDDERFATLLAPTLEASQSGDLMPSNPESWSRAAWAVLRERDRWPQGSADLGPWMEGPGLSAASWPPLQRAESYVTRLEALAECPWAHFLQRILRLEPIPDPLATLPLLDPRRVGSVVHGTLQRIVQRVVPPPVDGRLATVADEAGIEVPWPEPQELTRLCEEAALGVLRVEGLALPGLARALATRAHEYLEVCHQELFEPAPPRVVGSELNGEAELDLPDGSKMLLSFRADLAQRRQKELRLIDFKTSAPFIDVKRDEARRRHLLAALRSGTRLQGISYALGVERTQGGVGQGSYLHLRPDAKTSSRWIDFRGDDFELVDALRRVVAVLQYARTRGTFFPRLSEPSKREEPRRCEYCEVSLACVRGDSQSHRRQFEYFQKLRARREQDEALSANEERMLALWDLPGGKG